MASEMAILAVSSALNMAREAILYEAVPNSECGCDHDATGCGGRASFLSASMNMQTLWLCQRKCIPHG